MWGFSFCLLCSSCSVALPHVASPRVDTFPYTDVCNAHCTAGPLDQAWRYNLQETNLPREKNTWAVEFFIVAEPVVLECRSRQYASTVTLYNKTAQQTGADKYNGNSLHCRWSNNTEIKGWLVFTRHHQPAPIQHATTDVSNSWSKS